MNENKPPRYIDANQIRLTLETVYDANNKDIMIPLSDVLRCIQQTPDADVAPVVRCVNCEYAIRLPVQFNDMKNGMVLCTNNPGHYPFLMNPDEFCSRGKEPFLSRYVNKK